jgi:hypothetical protein
LRIKTCHSCSFAIRSRTPRFSSSSIFARRSLICTALAKCHVVCVCVCVCARARARGCGCGCVCMWLCNCVVMGVAGRVTGSKRERHREMARQAHARGGDKACSAPADSAPGSLAPTCPRSKQFPCHRIFSKSAEEDNDKCISHASPTWAMQRQPQHRAAPLRRGTAAGLPQ